jgi:small-conductance mechanosensitive channel/CRP-like cAMP-binding protein
MDSLLTALRQQFWPEAPFLVLIAIGAAMLLTRFRPKIERRSYRNTIIVFVMGLIALLLGGLAPTLLDGASGQRIGRAVSTLGVVLVGISSIRLTAFVIFRLILPLFKFQAPLILEDLLTIFGYSILALAQLRHVGIDVSTIFATSAVVTAVLAFAMQDTLGNVLGGIAIQLDDSIEIGDVIKVDDVIGQVSQIQWRSTQLQTPNWETVVIPNSRLMKGQFTVIGKRQGEPVQWRRSVRFSVDPKVAPARVIELALQAMMESSIAHVSHNPAPSCVVLGFDEGNVQYAARYFLTTPTEDIGTDSGIRVCVFNALQRHGIRIAEPQRTSNVVARDEEHMEIVALRESKRKLAILDSVDIFHSLTIDERLQVAKASIYAPFANGEWLTRQGKTAHYLYVIATGEAEVLHEAADGTQTHIANLGAGQFFGEMGLMTGEPRSASVRALCNMECYRVEKATFEQLIKARPEIAEDVTRVMANRKQLTNAVIASDTRNVVAIHPQQDLLKKVRAFFGVVG